MNSLFITVTNLTMSVSDSEILNSVTSTFKTLSTALTAQITEKMDKMHADQNEKLDTMQKSIAEISTLVSKMNANTDSSFDDKLNSHMMRLQASIDALRAKLDDVQQTTTKTATKAAPKAAAPTKQPADVNSEVQNAVSDLFGSTIMPPLTQTTETSTKTAAPTKTSTAPTASNVLVYLKKIGREDPETTLKLYFNEKHTQMYHDCKPKKNSNFWITTKDGAKAVLTEMKNENSPQYQALIQAYIINATSTDPVLTPEPNTD